jgi:SOS-response transcriptional repressor LexA
MLRKNADLTQEEAAQECGIPLRTFADYDRGETEPPADRMDHIRNVLGKSSTGTKRLAKKARSSVSSREEMTIPLLSVSAEAGSSSHIWEPAISRYMTIQRDIVSTETGAKPEDLAVVPVSGDSMADEITAGDRVVVVRHNQGEAIIEGAVYVWRSSRRGIILKRARWEDHETLQLISDNPKYDPITLRWGQGQDEWECLGHVVRVMSAV